MSSALTPRYANDLFRALDATFPEFPAPFEGSSSRAFSPNFDVKETHNEYVLEGEVPGLDDKNKLQIEFSENNTLNIRGKIERSVEREGEDANHLKTIEAGKTPEKIEAPEKKDDTQQVAKDGEKQVEKSQSQKPRYWVSERTVGEFNRSFSFPGTINVDEVKASLDHGILKIVVPKMEKKPAKRISVL